MEDDGERRDSHPAVVSLVMDVTGSYQTSYALMSGSAALLVVVAIIFAWVRRRSPVAML